MTTTMQLIHYSDHEITQIESRPQRPDDFKPRGLWVSDDDCEDNWYNWCIAEGYGVLTHVHSVELTAAANVLILSSAEELDQFTLNFHEPSPGKLGRDLSVRHNMFTIDWDRVRAQYDGLIITPYIWSRRLELMWYYCWDCASGCIWNPDVVRVRFTEIREPIKTEEE